MRIADESFSYSKNTSVSFAGKTGAGKSTLVDIILGLPRPQKGSIKIDDEKVDEILEKEEYTVDEGGFIFMKNKILTIGLVLILGLDLIGCSDDPLYTIETEVVEGEGLIELDPTKEDMKKEI